MKRILASLIILAATVLATKAGGILSDDFTYTNAYGEPFCGIVTNSTSTWLPNTGTANSMVVSNYQLMVMSLRSEDIVHTLDGGPYMTNGTTTALYSSFTLKCTFLPNAAGTYFAHFTGENTFGGLTGHRCRVWASTTNVATGVPAGAGKFLLGIANNGLSGVTNAQWSTELDTNVTYNVVTRYVIGTGISTLWIGPNVQSDPSVTDPVAPPVGDFDPGNGLPTNGVVNISHYGFRQASGEGTMLIDDLKVGTSFPDVAGSDTSPSISSIANQSIAASTSTGPLAFTVTDKETVASSLVVWADSSNTNLVTTNDISLASVPGGGGTNRTVTVTPIAGKQGATTITNFVSDSVNTSFTTFRVTVGAPSISAIPNQITVSNVPVSGIAFTVGDPEGDSLTLSNYSSNPTLISSIIFGGSGLNRTVTLTPAPNQIGNANITVYATDGTNTASRSFVLTVRPLLGMLFSDDFAYTSFTQPNSLYLATGSPWATIPPGTAFQIQVTNGLAYLIGTNSEDLGAALLNEPYYGSNGVVFYTGFHVNFSYLPSLGGDYFLHLKSSASDTSNFRCKVYGCRTGAATNMFRLGIANQSSGLSQVYPLDLSLGTTYAVVTRFNSGTGESVLWINPYSEQSPSVAATDPSGSSTIGGIALRQSSGIGDMTISRLRIATSFAEVSDPLLQVRKDGNNAILTWVKPWYRLMAAPNVTGTYTNVIGSTSPYTNPIANRQFFRLTNYLAGP